VYRVVLVAQQIDAADGNLSEDIPIWYGIRRLATLRQ
jgi:hypothetical protein